MTLFNQQKDNRAAEMLAMGKKAKLSIAEMKRANELVLREATVLDASLDQLWGVMTECTVRGLSNDDPLPGGLSLKRRSKALYDKLQAEFSSPDKPPHFINEWLALYAIAVNEENAAGGKIVTAPTNGAAGVIPAVINYYLKFCAGAHVDDVRDFLLVAGAIGGIIKHNGSIFGAEVGCQGEVGSASAMAAVSSDRVSASLPPVLWIIKELVISHET